MNNLWWIFQGQSVGYVPGRFFAGACDKVWSERRLPARAIGARILGRTGVPGAGMLDRTMTVTTGGLGVVFVTRIYCILSANWLRELKGPFLVPWCAGGKVLAQGPW